MQRGPERRRPPRRAENPVRVVAIAGGVVAAALLAATVVADRVAERVVAKAAPAEVAMPGTAVLSARRVPVTLSHSARVGTVERGVARAIASVPTGSCVTVDWEGSRLAALDADLELVPASAQKVIVAAVALEVLGPQSTFETVGHAAVDASGAAPALYLVGGGDPVLVTEAYPATEKYSTLNPTRLENLADALVAAGLRRVAGPVVGVDTRYDQIRFVDAWPTSFRFAEAGPLGALMVDDGAIVGEPQKPDDPALAAAEVFRRLLVARGVSIDGPSVHDVLPEGVPRVAAVSSAPLTAVLQEMLVNSDNNTAELLLKEIGLKTSGVGSTETGARAAFDQMREWGLSEGLVVVDGSGLARGNSVSCATFASLLERLSEQLPGLLPVAGETGTLREIFDGESVAGRLVGKTGTLAGVKSLVGYVPVEGGDSVRFTILMNRPGIDNRGEYRPVWYALANALARARSTPTAAELTPP